MSEVSRRLAAKVKAARERAGLTIEQAAGTFGDDAGVIRDVEEAVLRPTAKLLIRLSYAYKVTVERLIGVEGSYEIVEPPPPGALSYGIGSTLEEADLNKRRAKASQVPWREIKLPEDFTEEELQALILDHTDDIMDHASLVNSVLRALPDGMRTEHEVLVAQLRVRDAWYAAQSTRGILER